MFLAYLNQRPKFKFYPPSKILLYFLFLLLFFPRIYSLLYLTVNSQMSDVNCWPNFPRNCLHPQRVCVGGTGTSLAWAHFQFLLVYQDFSITWLNSTPCIPSTFNKQSIPAGPLTELIELFYKLNYVAVLLYKYVKSYLMF